MTVTVTDAERTRPSTLPRETTPRFFLAATALLIASVAIAEALWYGLHLDWAAQLLTDICQRPDHSACLAGDHARIRWTLAVLPVAAMAAIVIATLSSSFRRARLKPLKLPAAESLSAACAAEAGVSEAPLLWRVGKPVSNARADGLLRRYVEVGRDWVVWAVTDRERAAAILRHEYAHHRSRDVIIARWMIALSVVVVALAAALVIQVLALSTLTTVAVVTLRAGGILVVAALARSAVLRAREFDADRFAALTQSDGLRKSLTSPLPTPLRERWLTPFAHHPNPTSRLAAIDHPTRVHRPRIDDAVLVGLTTSIGATVISRLLAQWAGNVGWSLYATAIAWALVGILVGCWLSVTLWNYVAVNRDHLETDVTPPLGFAVALGAAMIVGNIMFSAPMMIATIEIPHHTVDVVTAILTATAIPVGAQWTGQLFSRVQAHAASASLFRGWGLVAGIVALLMTAGLIASTALMNFLAISMTGETGRMMSTAVDPNSPFEVFSLSNLWSSEWLGVTVPVLAVAGAVIAISCSPSLRARWRVLLSAVVSVPTLAIVVLQILLGPFHIIHRAADAGWFAAGRVITLMYATLGATAAVVAVTAACLLPLGRTIIAGALAALGSTAAVLIVSVMKGGTAALSEPIGLEVVPVSVAIAMTASAVLSNHPLTQGRKALIAAAGTAAISATAGLCVGSVNSKPTTAQDLDNYMLAMGMVPQQSADPAYQPLVVTAAEFCSGPVRPGAAQQISDALAEFRKITVRPVTAELRGAHDKLLDGLESCRHALALAADNDQRVLTPEQISQINAPLSEYERSLTDIMRRAKG